MLRFAADEGFRAAIVDGLRRRNPGIDIVTVQERGLRTAPDPDILEWAASEGRVLLTHDTRTMRGIAYQRVIDGQRMPGVFLVHWTYPAGSTIDELELLAGASLDGEWENQVRYLPVR